MRLYSTGTGQPYPAENAAELFECVVSELLTQAICWDNVIEGFVDRVKVSAASEVSLHSFCNSIPLRDLTAALNGNIPNCKTSINDFVGWISETNKIGATPRGPAQSKLAIVGMSCRLPGGATVSLTEDDTSTVSPDERLAGYRELLGSPRARTRCVTADSSRPLRRRHSFRPDWKAAQQEHDRVWVLHRLPRLVRCTVLQHVAKGGANNRSTNASRSCYRI